MTSTKQDLITEQKKLKDLMESLSKKVVNTEKKEKKERNMTAGETRSPKFRRPSRCEEKRTETVRGRRRFEIRYKMIDSDVAMAG